MLLGPSLRSLRRQLWSSSSSIFSNYSSFNSSGLLQTFSNTLRLIILPSTSSLSTISTKNCNFHYFSTSAAVAANLSTKEIVSKVTRRRQRRRLAKTCGKTTNAYAAIELALDSVVKIFTVSSSPNYGLPWQNKSQRETTGSGQQLANLVIILVQFNDS